MIEAQWPGPLISAAAAAAATKLSWAELNWLDARCPYARSAQLFMQQDMRYPLSIIRYLWAISWPILCKKIVN